MYIYIYIYIHIHTYVHIITHDKTYDKGLQTQTYVLEICKNIEIEKVIKRKRIF